MSFKRVFLVAGTFARFGAATNRWTKILAGLPAKALAQVSLGLEVHAAQQVCEARVRAQGVVGWV